MGWVKYKSGFRLSHDGGGVAQVGVDVIARSLPGACQQGASVRQHQWVVIHVHDAGIGCDGLGNLMGVVGCR